MSPPHTVRLACPHVRLSGRADVVWHPQRRSPRRLGPLPRGTARGTARAVRGCVQLVLADTLFEAELVRLVSHAKIKIKTAPGVILNGLVSNAHVMEVCVLVGIS